MRLDSIRLKAALLLAVVAVAPVVAALLLILQVNREAVKRSEKYVQISLLAEVSSSVTQLVRSTESDARAVAASLSSAASTAAGAGDGLDGVRAVLATRSTLEAARFEVPAAHVSTVIRGEGAAAKDVPESTAAMRTLADQRGSAFTVTTPGHGIVVVPIPPAKGAKPGAPSGYVTVAVDLAAIGEEVTSVIEQRFEERDAHLVVLDADARVVASDAAAKVPVGSPGATLGVLAALPQGVPWSSRLSVVGEHMDGATRMVGAATTIPDLGWVVAVWRPEATAYAALGEMRRAGTRVAIGTAIAALLIGLLAGRSITSPIVTLMEQAKLIGQRRWAEVRVPWMGRDEIGQLARSLQSMSTDLQQSEVEIATQAKLRGDLSRFLSKDLVDEIVAGRHALSLGGRRASVSVIFADVVAFTPLAETKPPEEVVALLNELFTMLSEIVFRHGGTVDKFIGDCLMGVFGAPIASQDHAEKALAAAEDMLRFLEDANEDWRARYGVEVRLGIGVNSGDALVGNIGSEKRMEYTVIGDVVNVAARLEGIASPNQILVGETTQQMVGDAFPLRLLGERRLTGRQNASNVYELPSS